VESLKETHTHPRSEGPNDVRIDSQFQRLLDNNSSNNNQMTQNPNKVTENKPGFKSNVPPQSAFSKANLPPNTKPALSNNLNETTNINNYNSTANTKQTTFVPTPETPVSNINNNPFSESLSTKNAYNTNNTESLNNSIISDKGTTGNKLDKLKNFLNNPLSNVRI
jgi:hypothetical protein